MGLNAKKPSDEGISAIVTKNTLPPRTDFSIFQRIYTDDRALEVRVFPTTEQAKLSVQ
jgi:hypothetical protein